VLEFVCRKTPLRLKTLSSPRHDYMHPDTYTSFCSFFVSYISFCFICLLFSLLRKKERKKERKKSREASVSFVDNRSLADKEMNNEWVLVSEHPLLITEINIYFVKYLFISVTYIYIHIFRFTSNKMADCFC
jgi:cbb3-type cytochrome oxidase subunit 3